MGKTTYYELCAQDVVRPGVQVKVKGKWSLVGDISPYSGVYN